MNINCILIKKICPQLDYCSDINLLLCVCSTPDYILPDIKNYNDLDTNIILNYTISPLLITKLIQYRTYFSAPTCYTKSHEFTFQ